MLIIIPTYKRNYTLSKVLGSLVQSHIDSIPEEIKVVVVNNYPPAANEIRGIVSEFSSDYRFRWKVICRERTLLPVDNWYSAIFENALPDEVVFINSDDDLFFPDSLQMRYHTMVRLGCDLLLAQLGPTVFFSEKGERILCDGQLPPSNSADAAPLGFAELQPFAPQHLSNHCYRNTVALKECFDHAMAWCEELVWLDRHNRIINFPMFLTFALCYRGGRVYGLPLPLILRGQELEEIVSAKYAVPGWNHGFVHGVALMIMNNNELKCTKELNSWRRYCLSAYIEWFPTYWFDNRLNWIVVKTLNFHLGLRWRALFSRRIIGGFVMLVQDMAGLRGHRLSRRLKRESIVTSDFLLQLKQL